MEVKKIKCPVCGKFKTDWLSEVKLKSTNTWYLVWCCTISNEEHSDKGCIFLSDIKLNPLSMEESDRIRDEINNEELTEWEEIDF